MDIIEPAKRKRGRPKKEKLSDDDMLEDIIFRAYDFFIDADGQLKLERNGTPLTLEETAFLVWLHEGKKTPKPLSKPMMIKTERSALDKIRKGLSKYGINSFDDVFDPKYRSSAKAYGSTESPE